MDDTMAFEKAKKMSIGRSHMDLVVNGPIALVTNGAKRIVDYMAAYTGCWQHKGFWIAHIFEDGHIAEA